MDLRKEHAHEHKCRKEFQQEIRDVLMRGIREAELLPPAEIKLPQHGVVRKYGTLKFDSSWSYFLPEIRAGLCRNLISDMRAAAQDDKIVEFNICPLACIQSNFGGKIKLYLHVPTIYFWPIF
jgi:hypothetical protein